MLKRSRTEGRRSGPTRVLVVDDDPDACELIARIIERHGMEAVRVHGHDQAMTELLGAINAFRAIVVDFSHGGPAAGVALLEDVRSSDAVNDVPVIILTRLDQNRVFAWQAGADGYLVRPLHASELVAELDAVLARTPEERKAHRQEALDAASH
jgi:two-component system, OmpR family, response regulator